MQLQFLGQPFDREPNLMDFVAHATDQRFDEIKLAVAWAKRSGLGRVWDPLNEYRQGGGKVTLIVGVSEGGATREGLCMATELADEAYVFHDPRRTFHPKVYYASSSGARSLLVGSSNLTAGGLGWNYEASLWADWGPGEGQEITDSVESWFESLIGRTESCRRLNEDLIWSMENSSDIVLGQEVRSARAPKKKLEAPEDNDSSVPETISGLFKPVVDGLRKLPGLSGRFTQEKQQKKAVRPTPESADEAPTQAEPAPFELEDVKRRWYKKLGNTDAQQVKSPRSKATGNLRLSQAEAPINHTRYFRDDFFGGLPWAPSEKEGRDQEVEVYASFNVWIAGEDHGVVDLRISHDPNRISGQGNVPTVLHWGTELGPVMRGTNYVGMYVTLERTHSGEFHLIVSENLRGEHLP